MKKRNVDSVIVLGDIHGCYDTLKALLEQLPKNSTICFVGDLVDRGPKSREVVQYVMDNGHDCVKGNHEIMMINEALHPRFSGVWMQNGGFETLNSYKVRTYLEDDAEEDKTYRLPVYKQDEPTLTSHLEWMKQLPLYIEYPDCKNEEGRYLVVSHSNVGKVWRWSEKMRAENESQFEGYIVWGRGNFHDNKDIYNIVGHTPCDYEAKVKSFYANVDTGCCFKSFAEHGILTAIQFPSMMMWEQKNIDKGQEHM